MNFKVQEALIPVIMFTTVGGLFSSLYLLRHGKKKAGHYMILASVGLFLLIVAYLTNFE